MNDDHAWKTALMGVTKLGEAKPNQAKLPKLPPATGTTPKPRLPSPHLANAQTPLPVLANTAQRLAGCHPSVPPKTFKQLSQGQLRPQGVIDLHGLREGDAWLELYAYLSQAQHAEVASQPVRVILIIHGKGRGNGMGGQILAPTEAGVGVIKSQLAGQLAMHPAVLAFHTALPADGGMGATYVLLKK